jgi:hypothetical protein
MPCVVIWLYTDKSLNVIFIYLLFTYDLYNDAEISSDNIAPTQEYRYGPYRRPNLVHGIAFPCLARFWDETGTTSPNSIIRLVLVMRMYFPFCEAWTEFLTFYLDSFQVSMFYSRDKRKICPCLIN